MKFLKIVIYAITYIVYPFSFLVPRTERKIAIGSFRDAFNDNAKYLFIYLSQNVSKHVSVAWISKSRLTVGEIRKRGLSAYWIFSPMGIWYALRSKYWFFNAYTSDIMWCLSGGACCINLWHGVGLKRIEFNITTGPLYRRYHKKDVLDAFMHPEVFKRPNYLLSSTPFQTAILSTAFRISQSQCLEMGYPRDEILLCSDELRTRHIDKYENETTHRLIAQMRKYSKVYIYMPTWRDSQRGLFAQNLDFVQYLN